MQGRRGLISGCANRIVQRSESSSSSCLAGAQKRAVRLADQTINKASRRWWRHDPSPFWYSLGQPRAAGLSHSGLCLTPPTADLTMN